MLHPRYWPTWLLMAFWWLLVLLPYPLMCLLGKTVGAILFRFAKTRRLITQRNIELCFPELSAAERAAIVRESFESAGMAFFETGIAWWWPTWRLKRITAMKGMEHVKNLDGQGVMLLGMHFMTLEIAGAVLSQNISYGAMYRAHENPVFNYVQYCGRSRKGLLGNEQQVFIPREDLRTPIKMLRDGKLVWYAPDQDYGIRYGVFAPFFGIPAATITTTGKLAQMGRARVLPFTHKRLTHGRGYEVSIHAPLDNYPTGNEFDDATRINQVIEQHIRLNPGQYLWAHRRFKSRPEGAENRYPEIYSARIKRRIKRIERYQKESSRKGDIEEEKRLGEQKEKWQIVQQENSRHQDK